MPRFYVTHENKWNIFSTIVDDFLFDDFVPFAELERFALDETLEERRQELRSLLTERPRLNVMDYAEAVERRDAARAFEEEEGDE